MDGLPICRLEVRGSDRGEESESLAPRRVPEGGIEPESQKAQGREFQKFPASKLHLSSLLALSPRIFRLAPSSKPTSSIPWR